MPPKKQPAASKKTEQKKQEKIIEDKTFGLKNKKGTKQQKFVKMVEHQVKHKGQSQARLEDQKFADKKSKKPEDLDVDKLFNPIANMPKMDKSVDPKSVLCMFFKQGLCGKGNKCKFSHDLTIEFKAEKRNIYVDDREEDNMDNWDEEKLHDVVNKKHGEKDKAKPKTAIICKYFVEALETSKYGWFWECPNGDKCIYRHALPPGYVLKKDKKKLDEVGKEDTVSLEELIEKERAALGGSLTKVTLNTFLAWKKKKIKEKRDKLESYEKKKRDEYKAGRDAGLSGRDLFTFNPDLVIQDDDEADDIRYAVERDEDETEETEVIHDVDVNMFRIDKDGEITEFPETQDSASSNPGAAMASNGGIPVDNSAGPSMEINEDLFDPDDIPDSDLDEDDSDDHSQSGEDENHLLEPEPIRENNNEEMNGTATVLEQMGHISLSKNSNCGS